MSAKTRKRHSAEFRAGVVRKMSTSGQTVQALAEELGLSPSLLFRWRKGRLPVATAFAELAHDLIGRFPSVHCRRRETDPGGGLEDAADGGVIEGAVALGVAQRGEQIAGRVALAQREDLAGVVPTFPAASPAALDGRWAG
jgi:hypothetical protein